MHLFRFLLAVKRRLLMLVAMALWGWRCEGVWKRRRSPNPHQQQLCARQAQGRKECFTFMAVQCSGVTTEYFLRPQTKAATTQKIRGDASPFGFNGQMKTNEIAGVGNHNTALFWEYDTRLGRRWNLDPVDQISFSNYSTLRDNPIRYNDPNGDFIPILLPAIPLIVEGVGLVVTAVAASYYGRKLGEMWREHHPPATPPAPTTHNTTSTDAQRWFPRIPLPRAKDGTPKPTVPYPHTQVGTKEGRKKPYPQSREWDYGKDGKVEPKKDIDWTDHGRPNEHPDPHEHEYKPNPTGGTPQRGPAKPVTLPKSGS